MFTDSDIPTRWILTQPALHPSNNVSSAALLNSLLSISHNIIECSRSKSFYAHHRNATQSIRLVRLVYDFLSEINPDDVSGTVFLCLSELLFIFHRIDFLLIECCRDDFRLWMLMKCHFVADQFRLLMRSLSTTLDLLPLHLLQVPTEVQETIQLVIRQARTSPYAVGSANFYSSKKIVSILAQFEKRVTPESSDLRSILNHLGIQSWSDCNKEINFLGLELRIESSYPKQKDLCSLIGFASYCRSVLFDVIDDAHIEQDKGADAFRSSRGFIRHLNTDDFRCPISLTIMSDPVTLCTGHTYDRSSILEWLDNGNQTCPKTGQRLIINNNIIVLLPNLALKYLILQYYLNKGIYHRAVPDHVNFIPVAVSSEAADEAMEMLARFLAGSLAAAAAADNDNDRVKTKKAAREIRLLTRSNRFNRSCLAEAGVIPHLLENVINSAEDAVSQEDTMAGLFNLSKSDTGNHIIFENGGLFAAVKILNEGTNEDARVNAAGTLFYLAFMDEYLPLIGEAPGCISGLVELLRQESYRSKKMSLLSISGLLRDERTHERIVSSGDVVTLLGRLLNDENEREDVVIDCLSVLALLTGRPSGIVALRNINNVLLLNRVDEILRSSDSDKAVDHCKSILDRCNDNNDNSSVRT